MFELLQNHKNTLNYLVGDFFNVSIINRSQAQTVKIEVIALYVERVTQDLVKTVVDVVDKLREKTFWDKGVCAVKLEGTVC